MHIVINKSKHKKGKKIYNSILLGESYRENGKVKKRTIANLSHCTPEEIEAIKLALKHKKDLGVLGSIKDYVELEKGMSVGAVWTIYLSFPVFLYTTQEILCCRHFFCLTLYLSSVYFIHYVLYKKNKKKKFGLFCGG